MNISRSAGYGMMAVGYIAQNDGDALVLASTVSKKYDIPNEYLLKILQQLVRANILRSKRGPRRFFHGKTQHRDQHAGDHRGDQRPHLGPP